MPTITPRTRHTALAHAAALSLFLLLPTPAPAANFTTTWNGTNGDWFDAAKWSAGVPNNTITNLYRAVINNGTVTLAASATTSGLSLAAPASLAVSTTYTNLTSSAGSTISGLVTLQDQALFENSDKLTLTNASINGDGTFRQLTNWLTLSGISSAANFTLDNGAALQGTGTLTITHHADIYKMGVNATTATLALTADASLNFTPATPTQVIYGNYLLNGITNITQGSLTSGSVTNAGTLNISSPQPGTLTYFGPATFVNTGTMNITSCRLNLSNATVSGYVSLDASSNLIVTGTAVNFTNAMVVGNGLLGPGISFNFAGESFLPNVALTSASSSGGTLHFTGVAQWTSGSISGSNYRIMVDSNAELTIGGVLTFGGSTFGDRGTLTNNGTTYIGVNAAGHPTSSTLTISSSAAFTNNNLLIIEAALSGSGTLTNSGVICNNSGTLSPQRNILPPILNTGTITGGFLLMTGTSSGMLSPDAGPFARTLTLNAPFTLLDGSVLTSVNSGSIIAWPTITIAGHVNADHFTFGALKGTGTVTLSGADNIWKPGFTALSLDGVQLRNEGILTIAASQNITLSSKAVLDNRGTLTWTSPYFIANTTGAIINFGIITAGASASIINTSFVNTGTITSGSATTSISGGGSASGYFITTSTDSSFSFDTNVYTLDNATLTGPGKFKGSISVLHTNSVSNAAFGYISGAGNLNVTDSFAANGTIIAANVTVLPTAKMSWGGLSPNFTLDGATVINQGLPSTLLLSTWRFANHAAFINQGVLSLSGTTNISNNSPADTGSHYDNTGTLKILSQR